MRKPVRVAWDTETDGLIHTAQFDARKRVRNKDKKWIENERFGKRGQNQIIQFAAAAYNPATGGPGAREIIETFEVKLKFRYRPNDPQQAIALALNSFDLETWKAEAVDRKQGARMIQAFLMKHATEKNQWGYFKAIGMGHNISTFDIPFLESLFREIDEPYLPFDFAQIDTLALARIWWWKLAPENRPKDMKLTTLAKFFGFENDGAHDALADVLMNIKVEQALKSVFANAVQC